MKNKLLLLAIFASSSIGLNAALINGAVTFAGQVDLYEDVSGSLVQTIKIEDAVALDFGNAVVQSADGDFASEGLGFLTPAIFTDFRFNPLTPAVVDPLWESGGFTFRLESIAIDTQTDATLKLVGNGFINKAGYEETEGTWSFTTQDPEAGGTFSFSASSESVPEPSTYAMFGTAFAILGFVGYKKRRNA